MSKSKAVRLTGSYQNFTGNIGTVRIEKGVIVGQIDDPMDHDLIRATIGLVDASGKEVEFSGFLERKTFGIPGERSNQNQAEVEIPPVVKKAIEALYEDQKGSKIAIDANFKLLNGQFNNLHEAINFVNETGSPIYNGDIDSLTISAPLDDNGVETASPNNFEISHYKSFDKYEPAVINVTRANFGGEKAQIYSGLNYHGDAVNVHYIVTLVTKGVEHKFEIVLKVYENEAIAS